VYFAFQSLKISIAWMINTISRCRISFGVARISVVTLENGGSGKVVVGPRSLSGSHYLPKVEQSCKKYIPMYERGIETKVHIKRNQSGSTFAMVKCRFESVETRLSSYTIANTTRRSYRNYYLIGTRVKREVVE